MKNLVFAAIDIGSYNCRLTIVEKFKNGFKIIHNFSHITNLIKDLSFNNEFTDKNTEKTLISLKKISEKLLKYHVNKYRCIATEACRQVINPEFFIKKVKKETGINVEVITTREEAELSLKSCQKYLKEIKDRGIIFDIGGGSTELTFFDTQKNIFNSKSISYGVINLSEKEELFGKALVQKHLHNHFNNFKNELSMLLDHQFTSIGSCSTVTTLCAIHQKLNFFDIKKVEGYRMQKFELLKQINYIKDLNINEIKQLYCVGSRYYLLLNGMKILKSILDIFPINNVIVTQSGLKEGILNDLFLTYEEN